MRIRSASRVRFCYAARQDRPSVVSSTAVSPDPVVPAGSGGGLSERRPLGDRTFQAVALVAGLLVLVILVLIAVSTSQQASSWFTTEGIGGIFSKTWDTNKN